jgi:hypothetical protein
MADEQEQPELLPAERPVNLMYVDAHYLLVYES